MSAALFPHPPPQALHQKPQDFGSKQVDFVASSDIDGQTEIFEHLLGQYSSKLPYSNNTARRRFTHDPYSRFYCVEIKFLPFHLSREEMRRRLTVLFDHISKAVIPLHWAENGENTTMTRFYVRYVDVSESDNIFEIDAHTGEVKRDARGRNIPAKTRYIAVESNYPCKYLCDLLASPNLKVVCDLNVFHFCWDGTLVEVREGDEELPGQRSHDAKEIMHCIDEVWDNKSLRGRHRECHGLGLAALKFTANQIV